MLYKNIAKAKFIDRPNRFIAHVELEGRTETVHVKNTGRCRELLLPEVRVVLEKSANPNRKTQYDLIAVYKEGFGLINMDSQAPNKVVAEWLSAQDFDLVKPEHKYGSSRIDFYMERKNPHTGDLEKYLMEVKGCTLEIDGRGYFPDAPTERGVKHLGELSRAAAEGYHAIMAYVIQMEGVEDVSPNVATHPAYGQAVERARAAGVEFLYLQTQVKPDELRIVSGPYQERGTKAHSSRQEISDKTCDSKDMHNKSKVKVATKGC